MYRLISSLAGIFLLCYGAMADPSEQAAPELGDESDPPWESAKAAYAALSELQGVWSGVGEGKWGTSSAEKTFAVVLDGKAICRSTRSVYPVQEHNPKGEVHTALTMITLANEDSELRLTEYDNEGFIARYLLDMTSSKANSVWVFELESGENLPPGFRARLTISTSDNTNYIEDFELDFSGKGYVTYLTNRLTRIGDLPDGQDCRVR